MNGFVVTNTYCLFKIEGTLMSLNMFIRLRGTQLYNVKKISSYLI